ncbi:DUF3152 domain-containing protein [Micromonospora taraxaci]|uniref:DUF3152 domain-containing protein n=1 Tax=Micromonospora taraxaci TaxID=1316803 RepID=UPI0033E11FC1
MLATAGCGLSAPASGQAETPRSGLSTQSSAPSPDDTPTSSPTPEIPTDAQIPTRAAGTFTTATGTGCVIGKGKKRLRYSASVEKGIAWGDVPAWKPDRFAASIEQVLAAPNGWATSAQHPVTNAAVNLTRASWSPPAGQHLHCRRRRAARDTEDGGQTLRSERRRHRGRLLLQVRQDHHDQPG